MSSDSVPGGYKASDGLWYSADGRQVWNGTEWVPRVMASTAAKSWAPEPDSASPENKHRQKRRALIATVGACAVIVAIALWLASTNRPSNDVTRVDCMAADGQTLVFVAIHNESSHNYSYRVHVKVGDRRTTLVFGLVPSRSRSSETKIVNENYSANMRCALDGVSRSE